MFNVRGGPTWQEQGLFRSASAAIRLVQYRKGSGLILKATKKFSERVPSSQTCRGLNNHQYHLSRKRSYITMYPIGPPHNFSSHLEPTDNWQPETVPAFPSAA